MYGDEAVFRRWTGLSIQEVSSGDLSEFFKEASKLFLSDIAVPLIREECRRDSADSTLFYLPYSPLADSNFDKVIDSDDIIVELYDDEAGSYTPANPESLDAFKGKVWLEEAPASDIKVLATYWYYYYPQTYHQLTQDWSRADLATSLLAGMMVIQRKVFFLPSSVSLGSLRISWGGRGGQDPLQRFEEAYLKVLNSLRSGRL